MSCGGGKNGQRIKRAMRHYPRMEGDEMTGRGVLAVVVLVGAMVARVSVDTQADGLVRASASQ